MQKAYIILAHKFPGQLKRLVERLSDGSSHFFIHIDKAVDIALFEDLRQFETVEFVDRVTSKWASYSIVQATLNGMQAVQKNGKPFDRIILLSGQDYPIKSNAAIDEFFRQSPHSVFLDYFPIPNYKKWPGGDRGGWYRVDKYYIGLKRYELFGSKSMNLMATFLPFLRRRMPKNMKPFTGSQWWVIDRYALDYILAYVQQHPEYVAFHKYTFASDELFFHMLLVNSGDEELLKRITNDNKRFMLWQKSDSSHPDVLRKSNLEVLLQSDALFARKFDAGIDTEILNLLDNNVLLPGQSGSPVLQPAL